jgi:NitT/TauT family transport system permease protein
MEKHILKRGKKKNNSDAIALPIRIVLLAACIIIWELIAKNNIKISFYTSYPSAIFFDLIDFFKTGNAWGHIGTTMKEAYLGLLYGTIAGVGLGVFFSQFKILGKIFTPIISVAQGIPQLTLAPLYILWFGIGFTSKVVLSSLMVFFNVFFSTYNAIKNIDQRLIESATLLGAGKGQILWHVVIPASMPWIMSGIRIGSSVCMVGAIIGEYIGASRGLGWMVTYASSFFQIKRVMSCIVVLMVIGLLVTWILEKIEQYLLRWRAETNLAMKAGK